MAKKKIICDTDVMIDFWDLTNARHANTKIILEENIELDNVLLSAITKMELLLGATNKQDLAKIKKNLQRFDLALLDSAITIKAFELLEKYHLSHGLALPDCIIAATAIITDLELFTYNLKDYRFISGLKIHNIS